MERYKSATTEEKAVFTQFGKILKDLTHISERGRELTGDKSWVKFKFNLKKNNPHIHAMEFGIKKGIIQNIRFVIAKTTQKGDFFTQVLKIDGAKKLYGNIVLHIPCEGEEAATTLLQKIDKLAEESEIIEMDPKRTYCDPPAGWVNDRTGKEGVTKKEEVLEPTKDAIEKAA